MLDESFSVFLFQQSLEFHLRAGGELFRIRQKLVEQFRRPRFVAATAHIGERGGVLKFGRSGFQLVA
jgi:hypothetical protein